MTFSKFAAQATRRSFSTLVRSSVQPLLRTTLATLPQRNFATSIPPKHNIKPEIEAIVQVPAAVTRTDSNGHVTFNDGFLTPTARAIEDLLRKTGITDAVAKRIVTTYLAQMHLRDVITATAKFIRVEDGSFVVKTTLHTGNSDKPTAVTYTAFAMENAKQKIPAALIDHTYDNVAATIRLPITPAKAIGTKVATSTVFNDQVRGDGRTDLVTEFSTIHEEIYEPLITGTAIDFGGKRRTVMSDSDVSQVGPGFKPGEIIISYLTTQKGSSNSAFQWQGTQTRADGIPVVVAYSKHAILDAKDNKFMDPKQVDPHFIQNRDRYLGERYPNMFNTGIFPDSSRLVVCNYSPTITEVTLTRPDGKPNVIDVPLIKELEHAVEHSKKQGTTLVLHSGDKKIFCAGADITRFAPDKDGTPKTTEQVLEFSKSSQDALDGLRDHGKVISVVSGMALGGGSEAALASKIILVTPGAKMSQPEVQNVGNIACFGAHEALVSRVGPHNAAVMLLTGGTITARQALDIGYADAEITRHDQIEKCVEMLKAGKITSHIAPPVANIQAVYEQIEAAAKKDLDNNAACLRSLQMTGHIPTNVNIKVVEALMNAVSQASLASLGVLKQQVGLNHQQCNQLESETFANIAATPTSQMGLRIGFTDRKTYENEHKFIQENRLLEFPSLQLDVPNKAKETAVASITR